MIDIREVAALWCDDITFCPKSCDGTDCPRNMANIQDRTIPHSFSIEIPEDCPRQLGKDRSMQKSDNRSNGGRFERELADKLAEHGFWVHVLQQNASGQPADIIAVKGKFHTLIDCKVISGEDISFPFERIESNQKFAMHMFQKKCRELCYFALKLPDGSIKLVSIGRIETLKGRGRKRLTQRDIEEQTWSLEKWLESSDTWSEDV